MKKILAVSAAALVAQLGLAAPASADTFALPNGHTATLTIPDVTMNPTGGCIHHYGTFSTTTPLDWDVDLDATGPSTWPPSDYLYGFGPSTQIVDLLLCPSFDGPGLYTLSGLMEFGSPWEAGAGQAIISDQFTVSRPAPVVTPPPPPPAPVVTYSDVRGTVAKKMITRGVKFTFKAKPTPVGSVVRNQLKWTVLIDDKVRSFTQKPDTKRVKSYTFARGSGVHKLKVLRNGKVATKVTVRA